MAKRRRIVKRPRRNTNFAKLAGRAAAVIVGGLVGIAFTFATAAMAIALVWLTVTGEWDGIVEAWNWIIAINPTLASVVSWVTVVALILANIGFYHLAFRLYKRR
ncbi:MAG: hypothetical protein AAGB97_06325 [Dehalococcoidia bacterium]|nr:hypothetical protein [Chloroflexota bacterium]MBT9162569.1 hypothetical protein [Chloroflexota bacterium]